MRSLAFLLALGSLTWAAADSRKPQVPLVKASTPSAFNPRDYEQFKVKTKCSALNRNGGQGKSEKVSIDIEYVDVNPSSASRTLLFVHGWPGLWSTWSNQIQHFQDEYHLLVPDLRGFGGSSHPGDVEASGSMGDLVSDLICVLNNAGVEKAVCVGHDWGAQVCWEAARMRPDRFEGVAGAVVPYLPSAGEFTPVEHLSKALPHLTYQIYFEKSTKKAVEELNTDIRRSLRATYRTKHSAPPEEFLTSKSSFLKAYRDEPIIDPSPFFTKEEEDYLVEQFERQGFDYTLQFYTYHNRYESWDFTHKQGNHSIPQPALYIVPVSDPVADWPLAALIVQSSKFIPHLTTKALDTAHWPQLEQPAEFNTILEQWLDDLDVNLLEAEVAKYMKAVDDSREKLFKARQVRREKEWTRWIESASDRIFKGSASLSITLPHATTATKTKANSDAKAKATASHGEL